MTSLSFFSAVLLGILGVEIDSAPGIYDTFSHERIASNPEISQNSINQLPGAPGAPVVPGAPGTDPIIDEEPINIKLKRAKRHLSKAFDNYEDAENVLRKARRELLKNEDYLDGLKKKLDRLDLSSRAQSFRFRNDIKYAQKKMNRNLKNYVYASKNLSEVIKELDKLSREILSPQGFK